MACAAIADRHRSHGLDDPVSHEAVRQVRRGLCRTLRTAPRRQARPLSVAEIGQILTQIERATSKGTHDAALILLGFASALRRSELVALTLDDMETKPAGLLVAVLQGRPRATRSDRRRRPQPARPNRPGRSPGLLDHPAGQLPRPGLHEHAQRMPRGSGDVYVLP